MTEQTVGEALVQLLEAYGVRTIFGIPGVHNVEMYRALPRSSIQHILTRHEQGAGFMADGFARATGEPGVCFTISGPGVTNILTPLGQAWSDSSPVLVISTALDMEDSAQGRGRLHEMRSQFKAAESVTSRAWRCYTALDIQDAIAAAFACFASARPRPAYVEIPLDLLTKPAGKGWQKRQTPGKAQAPREQILQAVEALTSAKNPFIILGGGAQAAGAHALRVAEATGAAILTTTAGKGTAPANHSHVWGFQLGRSEVQALLQAADCILAVGTELSETDFWTPDFRLQAPLIRIDIDAEALARPHAAKLAICADAESSMQSIAEHFEGKKPCHASLPEQVADELREELANILSVIRAALPPETIIVSDMTQIAYAANEVFPVALPRTWHHPVGFGTLGFALPAAIGAKFGAGAQPVVTLAGDYGFQYTLNELGTAVEHRLSLPILLWNNTALGQIRDDMVQKGIQPNAVTLRNPDFQALAKAYGARAEKPASLQALPHLIAKALVAEGPTLIELTRELLQH